MSETDNSNNPDYREYYLLNAWWDNTWVLASYCANCACSFPVNNNEKGEDDNHDITFNVYKVKNDLYCEKDYIEIQQNHMKRGVKWFGELYFENVKESRDLQ